MGAFSDLAIDKQEREEKGLTEWAVVLNDPAKPVRLWRVLGESRGFFLLYSQGEEKIEAVENCWVIA